jgi:glyoxylase-like metal-dependent hydrolase (beta-lactamase superfamily II)
VSNQPIHTIDLHFKGRDGTIGVYLVPHSNGCILVETGPGSTLQSLLAGMKDIGYAATDVTDIFLTHIHLDHAGAAGWWAQNGATIHVHEFGAPHLLNPEKLLASATRLYGDMMHTLWGDFLPVPEAKLHITSDDEIYQVNDLSVHALDVPGHANHHLVFLIDDACFSGDIGGIRLNSQKYLSIPMPPPEFHLEKWRASIQRIQSYHPRRIVPTHFGVYDDADWHLQAILDGLDEVEKWMEAILPSEPSLEVLRQEYIEFERMRSERYGISEEIALGQQIANPSFISADGILRYWNKYRKSAEKDWV